MLATSTVGGVVGSAAGSGGVATMGGRWRDVWVKLDPGAHATAPTNANANAPQRIATGA